MGCDRVIGEGVEVEGGGGGFGASFFGNEVFEVGIVSGGGARCGWVRHGGG